jgi:hypothetical protein
MSFILTSLLVLCYPVKNKGFKIFMAFRKGEAFGGDGLLPICN